MFTRCMTCVEEGKECKGCDLAEVCNPMIAAVREFCVARRCERALDPADCGKCVPAGEFIARKMDEVLEKEEVVQ